MAAATSIGGWRQRPAFVMAGLGLVTLWAGIASWRHNARSGLHAQTASGSYAQGDAPPPADEPGSPGTDAH